MRTSRISAWLLALSIPLLAAGCKIASVVTGRAAPTTAVQWSFKSNWPDGVERVWLGPEFWANRLQDWRIVNGRLECVESRPSKHMRTVHLLTCSLADRKGTVVMSVRTGAIGKSGRLSPRTWTGFLLGAGGRELDYRAAALVHHLPGRGGGLIAALDGEGKLVFRDMEKGSKNNLYPLIPAGSREGQGFARALNEDIELRLEAVPVGDDYRLTLSACDFKTGKLLGRATLEGVSPDRLVGNIALVSEHGPAARGARYWFRDWRVGGSKVDRHDDRIFGPVLCTQYTLSDSVLKMTAQFPPLGKNDSRTARLQIRYKAGERWRTIAEADIVWPSYTATFRVENWDSSRDTHYRVVYALREGNRRLRDYSWEGVVRRDPVDKNLITVAAFTGNNNVGIGADSGLTPGAVAKRWTLDNIWFPHNDLVEHVRFHDPDILVFTGDQVYEGRSPTAPERQPEDKAMLDYLYKWYLWCWAFRDLARDRPCICMPDDHDVYQGNLWGWSGRKSPENDHNNGGYRMSAEFVRMVERTQTSHLPDPYDPRPVERGIGVYFCSMRYGGISFAVLEDRKFKSPPTLVCDARIFDGHIMDQDYDTKKADVPGATLLGERQLKFLRHWAADWRGVYMKVALSQTIPCNLQTRDYYHNKLDRDLDSNGWPQSGRNRMLRELRRGFAFLIAGDQHLASVVHHGIDDWNDAIFSFCVPSIANFYLRFWNPPKPGRNHKPGMPPYTGEYLDGLGNHITVYAVANPKRIGDLSGEERSQRAVELHRKAPGYGIARLNKKDRTITIECWPRKADPRNPGGQYPGWPVIIRVEDNYGRKPLAYLTELEFVNMTNPVVQVINESNGEIVYTIRAKGKTFKPKVFERTSYTVRVGEPGTSKMRELRGIQTLRPGENKTLRVEF